jgi:hypothetical protein
MMRFDLTETAVGVVSLSIALERIVEAMLTTFETITARCVKNCSPVNQARYKEAKTIIAIILAVLLGIGVALSSPTFIDSNMELNYAGLAAFGALAGFLAPYSHQLISLGYQKAQVHKHIVKKAIREANYADDKARYSNLNDDNIDNTLTVV